MSHHLSPAKFMIIATAMLSTPVVGQDLLPPQTTPLASKADSVSNNDATNEWETREESTVIPLRHVQANWVVMNIQQLFKKQKEAFSIIGDDRQIVVRGNKHIIAEILDVVESIDRPPKSNEVLRNDLKRSALPVGIAEEVVAELKDVESPEGRDRLKTALRKEFERNQSQLRDSLKELAARVKESQELLARRDQLADQIIDLRFKELIAAKPSGEEKHATESVDSTLQGVTVDKELGVITIKGTKEEVERTKDIINKIKNLKQNAEPDLSKSQEAPTPAQPMRTPDEYVKLLQEYRSGVKRYAANQSRRQAIIDQLSKSENLNDQDKRNLKLEEEGLVSDKAASDRSLNNWKRIWSEYRTQLELLQLDIKDGETVLSSLEKKAVQTKQQVSQGLLSQQELEEQLTRIDLARTKIDRAKKIFELYAEIEKSDPTVLPPSPNAGTGTLDSKQPADEKSATKPVPSGARAFGGHVARPAPPSSTRTVDPSNGDLAFEARAIQNLDNARIHLCKVTLAGKFAERDKVEVIQTISTNTEGRFSGFIPPEYTSLFEREPSDPYLALVVEAEGFITDSRSSLPEHWNNDMNFGLEPNEKNVKGQILVDGNPAGSVSVTAIGVERAYPDELDAFLQEVKSKPIDVKATRKQTFYDGPNPLPLGLTKTNVILSAEHTATDNQGRFELRGFGPNDVLTLEIEGQGVEKTWLRVINRNIDRINLRHSSGYVETYYGCGFTYDHTQVETDIGR